MELSSSTRVISIIQFIIAQSRGRYGGCPLEEDGELNVVEIRYGCQESNSR